MAKKKNELHVKPNTIGYFYKNNKFEKKLEPGVYKKMYKRKDTMNLFLLPISEKLILISNQEVLTKDNIALRFSYNVVYQIVDGEKFLSKFPLDRETTYIIYEAEQRIYNIVQIFIRNKINELDSETLNEKRAELNEFKNEEMEKQANEFGISIKQAQLKDLTFPKSIQDLFSKHLEAKIRSKADLENARTAVATARALKNASELMKDDENIKFFQILETINKIAEKGKHTFMIGDIQQFTKK